MAAGVIVAGLNTSSAATPDGEPHISRSCLHKSAAAYLLQLLLCGAAAQLQ